MPEMDRLSQAYKQLKKQIKKLDKCNTEVESIGSARERSRSPASSRETDSASESSGLDRSFAKAGPSGVEHFAAEHSVSNGQLQPSSAQVQDHKFAEALTGTLGDFNEWFLEREEESMMYLDQLAEEYEEAKAEDDTAD
eukprot:scaffold81489_cov42-Prasinocladus_malaysianus.AAC.3